MKLNSLSLFTVVIFAAILLCSQVANGQEGPVSEEELNIDSSTSVAEEFIHPEVGEAEVAMVVPNEEAIIIVPSEEDEALNDELVGAPNDEVTDDGLVGAPNEEEALEPGVPLDEQLVGFWTAPSIDLWNIIPGPLGCMPDNMTIARVPNSLFLNATYKFSKANLQCQALSLVNNQGSFILKPITQTRNSNARLSQPGDPVTYYLSKFFYSQSRHVASFEFRMGEENLGDNMRVYSQQTGAACSFYMTEKKTIETAAGEFMDILISKLATSDSSSAVTDAISTTDSMNGESDQIKIYLIITSVGFGITSVAVMTLIVLLHTLKRKSLSQRAAVEGGNKLAA